MSAPEPLSAERLAESVETALRDSFPVWHQTPCRLDFAAEAVVKSPAVATLLAEVSRLREESRSTWDAHGKRFLHYAQTIHDLKEQRDGSKAEVERLTARVAELEAKLHNIAMTRTWQLETGKKFVFVEDIAPILFDLPKAEDQRNGVLTAIDDAVKVRDYEAAASLRQELRDLDDAKAGGER